MDPRYDDALAAATGHVQRQGNGYDIAKGLADLNLKSNDKWEGTPVDRTATFTSFMEACRRGDLKECHRAIVAGVNINARDEYDYTPLIIASICGHYELVKLLLDYGALAERNTFQGERCIYGALTLTIRKLLLKYDFSKSTDPLRAWSEYVNGLRQGTDATKPDFTIRVPNGSCLKVHRFWLVTRSTVFKEFFEKNPGATEYVVRAKAVSHRALSAVIDYLYMVQNQDILYQMKGVPDAEERLKEIKDLAVELGFDDLIRVVEPDFDSTVARKWYQDSIDTAQRQAVEFFNTYIVGNKVTAGKEDISSIEWTVENTAVADVLIKAVEPIDEDEDPQKFVAYPAHKAILARSEFFQTMFTSGFRENTEQEHLHIVDMHCAPQTLEILLSNLYTEQGEISLEYSLDLLYAADTCLLPKLVNKAALTISSQGMSDSSRWVDRTHKAVASGKKLQAEESDDIDIFQIIHAAWELKVLRLEEFGARFLAARLEDYIDGEPFANIIRESAERTQNRHATDTIELLDDIRHYLDERFQMRFQNLGMVLARDMAAKERMQKEQEDDLKKESAIKTLSGEMATDEFQADDLNYQFLMQKIDLVLGKLGLSA